MRCARCLRYLFSFERVELFQFFFLYRLDRFFSFVYFTSCVYFYVFLICIYLYILRCYNLILQLYICYYFNTLLNSGIKIFSFAVVYFRIYLCVCFHYCICHAIKYSDVLCLASNSVVFYLYCCHFRCYRSMQPMFY